MAAHAQIILLDADGSECCRGSWGDRGLAYVLFEDGNYRVACSPAEGATTILALVRRFMGHSLICIDQRCSVKDGEHIVIGLKTFTLRIRKILNRLAILNIVTNTRLRRAVIVACTGVLIATSLFTVAPIDSVSVALQVARKWELTWTGM